MKIIENEVVGKYVDKSLGGIDDDPIDEPEFDQA
jgi:hypothetical protein